VVPACRSLDCVSIFANSIADAQSVLAIAKAHDALDPFSREAGGPPISPARPRIGVLPEAQWEFFGHDESARLYAAAIERCAALGYDILEIDYTPFRDAAAILYNGPRVAERLAAVGDFLASHPASFFPVTREIIAGAAKWTAVDAYRAEEELRRLHGFARVQWARMDALLLPTAPFLPRVSDVLAEPLRINSQLGTYTNFVNLLDCAAIAVPAGHGSDGLPFGVTFIGPAETDTSLARIAAAFTGEEPAAACSGILLAVVGAHLTGQPLNHQLTSRGAQLRATTRTAPHYRLFRLPNTTPPKPGLRKLPGFSGPGIEVEIWELSARAFGEFVAEVPAPMGIGTVELADGTIVKGFLCEVFALEGAEEITAHGGWRAFLKHASK
jgi:allophanate hydrolase